MEIRKRMSLITYLQSIEWLTAEADAQTPRAADAILSDLLDLDLER